MSEPEITPEAVEAALEPGGHPPGYSPYKLGIGVSIVIFLASLSLFLAFLTLWADRQVLDTDQWTETSTEVIQQPAVRDALASYLVTQLFDKVDVEQELKDQLPNDWDVLASPATSGLRSLALSGTKAALDQPAVQSAWKQANRLAHAELISMLEGGNAKVNTENGVVTIDGRLILADVAKQVGLSGNLVNKIPANAGTFEIYRSDDLKTVQNAYKVSKDLRWVFAGLAALLFVVAIWLASGRRRRAVTWMGISFVVVALLVLITVSLGRSPVVDSLSQTSSVVPAVTDIYNIATELLRRMAGSLLFTGVLVILASLVAGPYRWAIAIRRFFAPYFRDYLGISIAAAALLFLIVLWLVPVTGFRTTVGLSINIILAIAGFAAFVHICRQEFPDAELADFGAVGDWTRERWVSTKDFVGDRTRNIDLPKFGSGDETTTITKVETTGDAPTVESAAAGDKVAELERLATLHKNGALTDAEFEAAKKQLL